jgi:DNA-binding LacI/PurR family transcriptional regulator
MWFWIDQEHPHRTRGFWIGQDVRDMNHGSKARRRFTLRDLAESLGVSKTTVSNAFSRPDQLSPELRARVLEAARAAGYAGPNPVARMLRTGRAGALGLILPESLPFALDDPVTAELIRGIADACEERRLGLLIIPGASRVRDPRAITDVAVDGFIAYSLPWDTPVLQQVLVRGAPVVVVDEPRMPGVATVSVDDPGGARMAARHLVQLGHRRLGIVTLPFKSDGYTGRGDEARISAATFDVASRRLEGYRAALAEAGLAAEEVPVYECAHSDEELGRQAGRDLLERAAQPTALLAMSDRLALGVLAAARELRVNVPKELSVVGFDDIAGAARSRPSLTTVRQPLRLKGYAAARFLLDAPGTPPRDPGTGAPVAGGDELDFPVELVIRRSTAAPHS